MSFLVILLCLLVEKLWTVSSYVLREQFFDYYLNQINWLVPKEWQERPYGLWFFLVPLLIIVTLLHTISVYYFSNLFTLLLEAFLLWVCLGPWNIYNQLDGIPKDIFERAHAGFFSVLFWFALLGPLGAVLFRILERISNTSMKLSLTVDNDVITVAKLLTGYLNWLPLRLFIGLQAIFGKFPDSVSYWLDHLLTGASSNNQLAFASGRIALGLSEETVLEIEHRSSVIKLFDNMLLTFLGILFVLYLGQLVFL